MFAHTLSSLVTIMLQRGYGCEALWPRDSRPPIRPADTAGDIEDGRDELRFASAAGVLVQIRPAAVGIAARAN